MGLLNDKVSERRRELINDLKNKGIFATNRGMVLESVSLADLEWMHVESINEAMRAYGSDENEKVH